MTDTTAFLFPGQGAYLPGALSALRAAYPEVDGILSEVDEGVRALGGAGVSKTLLAESPPSLDQLMTDDPGTLQLALYATDLAVHRIFRTAGHEPSFLVGHSLGEIPALVAAGAFDVRAGAQIICERNTALRPFAQTGGMLAIAGDERKASALVDLVDDPALTVAVLNAPRQVVLSGPSQALAKAKALAELVAVQATPLNAPFPFHNRLLANAAEQFRDRISSLRRRPLNAVVYSPILGRVYTDADDLAAILASHLTIPVRFVDAVRVLHARGVNRFVECGARSALTSLVRATVPDVTGIVCLDGRTEATQSMAKALDAFGGVVAPVAAPAAPVVPSAPSAGGDLDRRTVLEQLRTFYAAELEYPVEVLEDDADLEADLGVDSLKQTELLSRAGTQYGLTELPEDFSIADCQTLASIADLLVRHAR